MKNISRLLLLLVCGAYSLYAQAPSLVSFTPKANANDVSRTSAITVTFNKNINPATLSDSSCIVFGSLSGSHAATFQYNASTFTATITPVISFKSGDVVWVTLTRALQDGTGDSLQHSYSWTFTAKTDSSSGIFMQTSSASVGINPFTSIAVDVNNDGYTDIISVNNGDGTISILKNNKDGTFSTSSTISVGSYPGSVAALDVDGDGNMDLAVTVSGENEVVILKNDGTGSFTQSSAIAVGSVPWDIIAADVNGDGKADLVVTNAGSGSISILINQGNGTFQPLPAISVGSMPVKVTPGDINGDGYVDLISTNYRSNNITVLTNNGIGVFTVDTTIGVGSGPYSTVASDLFGNGLADLAVSNYTSNTISILKNSGNGSFVLSSTLNVPIGPVIIAATDVNGDGNIDLVAGSTSVISILKNNEAGVFTPSSSVPLAGGGRAITLLDIDNDGSIDLAVTNNVQNEVFILKNNQAPAGVIPRSGLVAWYPFNGNANDSSGNGFNGTVVRATLTTDRFGMANSAYSFDGTTSIIRCGDILDSVFCAPIAKFSVSGWAMTRTYGTFAGGGGFIIGKNGGGNLGPYQWNVTHEESGLYGYVLFDTLAQNYIALTSPMTKNQWFHFVLVFDGSLPAMQRLNLYVNGQSSNTSVYQQVGTIGTTTTNSQQPLTIGATYHANTPEILTNFYDGNIDDIRIYNRVLSVAEVAALYNEDGWVNLPRAPQNLTSISGNSVVTLTWIKNTEPDFLRYRIYGGTTNNPTTKIDSTTNGISDTTIVISGLTNGVMYYFRVTEVDSTGNESPFSNVVNATPSTQVITTGDTTYISGSTFSGVGYLGELDSTISSDTTSSGARKDPNRVYALYEGQVYYQLTPIYYNNPTGTLTIVGVPDPKSPSAKTKPIIIILPSAGAVPSNKVYGSIKIVNVHWQVMEWTGNIQSELFYCGTANKLPQSLTIDNCLFEFCNIDLFDCTNESGAIGGWPYGAKFFITNSYFRNMFEPGQWWSSRVFQCKHPIDTLWVENNTIIGGGLTFLQQNALTDFGYFNHNTIINNKKYWLLSPYHRVFFVTNNIFVNQNWTGEDTNVVNAEDPFGKEFTSTITIDSINADQNGVAVQPKYNIGDSTQWPPNYSPLLALSKMQVFISDNINYYDSLLINGYYRNSAYILADTGNPEVPYGSIPSYLGWYYPSPQRVENIPGEWENLRTQAILAAYSPDHGGGMIEEHTTTLPISPILYGMTSAVVTAMAQWNQHQYNDPRFATPTPALTSTAYIYGDYNPQTLPGIVGGAKTDAITNTNILGPNDQVGISKFTDLTENFSQSTVISTNDGFPIGSLIWNDTQNAGYAAAHSSELAKVLAAYFITGITVVKPEPVVPSVFNLAQNYPDPFNPSTTIQFTVPSNGRAILKIFNLLGQEVATLFDGEATEGTYHQVQFNGSNLASGIYFSRLEFGGKMQVKKMLLLK